MLLKGFSYAMGAAFAGGLVFTLVGASQTLGRIADPVESVRRGDL